MAQTRLGPSVVNTLGDLPATGGAAPDFVLSGNDLADVRLQDFAGMNVVLNIFPSIDTSVCATSVREFNKRVAGMSETVILNIAMDLPFAMRRFCGAEGIDRALTLSDFRHRGFGKAYGVELTDGSFAGLFARAVVVIDKAGKIKYTELVPQIREEPDYEAALAAL